MNTIKKVPKAYNFFGIFILLFVALMVFVEIKNGKFYTNDFKVYYLATKDFFSGNNPYVHPYGLSSGYFKYPPTTLYFFFPSTIFGYFTAQILHTILLYFSLVIALCSLHKLIFINAKSQSRIGLIYLSFVFIAIHVVREFHMGNINLFLLVLFVLGIQSYLRSKIMLMVLFWSLMVILKPIVVLAFIPLLVFKQWKAIGIMTGIGLLFFLFPVLHIGFEATIELWTNWFKAISQHGDYIVSENSLKYLSQYYMGTESAWLPSIIGLIVLLCVMIWDLKKRSFTKQEFIAWTIIFMAYVPNFFVTDTEHFLLTVPLILLVFRQLLEMRNAFLWSIFILITACFSLKSNDLLGKDLADFVNETGLLGIANMCYIVFFILIKNRSSKIEKSETA